MAGVGLNPDLRIRAFLLAFVGGTAAIVAIRTILPHLAGAVLATVVAVLAIVALGLRSRRAEARAQAGDDLYYLGLLFTLVSLIWALVQLFILDAGEDDAAARTNQLVGNFGIALVSTVAGIVGRILFQSELGAEPDRAAAQAADVAAAEREDELDRLYADVARELRDQMRQARDAMSHFTRMTLTQAEETRQHTERLAHEFNQHLRGLAEAGLEETSKAWQEIVQAMRQDAERLLVNIDTAVAEATRRTESAWQDVATHAESASAATRAASAEARANVDAINSEVTAMLERLSAVSRALPALATAMDQAEASAMRLGRTATDAATGLDARAAEIVAAHNALAQGTRSYSEASVEAYRGAIEKSLVEAHDRLHGASQAWLKMVEEFHEAGQRQRKAGEQAVTQAEELTRRMSSEVENWTGLAERTRKGIVEAVDDLSQVVRKA